MKNERFATNNAIREMFSVLEDGHTQRISHHCHNLETSISQAKEANLKLSRKSETKFMMTFKRTLKETCTN